MTTPLIAVTGATGKTGGTVAEHLRDAGLSPRLLARDASRAHYDVPDREKDAWVSTYTTIAAGELNVLSDAVERLTERHPLSLHDLLVKG